MTFQLDTSGYVGPVDLPNGTQALTVTWGHLSPFCQGYIEAMLNEARRSWLTAPNAAFRHLAPVTLARIIADCDRKAAELACPLTAQDGGAFWRKFMSKVVTHTLGDDGLIYLGAA